MSEYRPKLLDLFCCAGGAGMGYYRAGFDVTGVDIKPQQHYPFRFIQADALAYVAQYGWMYDAIHASPPCQAHSSITPDKSKHVDLIPHTRYWLETIGAPYVIENVGGARKALRNAVMLCGTQFKLNVFRHRYFESNIMLMMPVHIPHNELGLKSVGCSGKGNRISGTGEKAIITVAGHFGGVSFARKAMGIDWMNAEELAQAIPPVYTEYLGHQLMNAVVRRLEAVS